MTDKELNTAILNELYKIADEIWASIEKGVHANLPLQQ